ncbi:hypothetical protein MASR1M101_05060 [Gemmatimonas sp.]
MTAAAAIATPPTAISSGLLFDCSQVVAFSIGSSLKEAEEPAELPVLRVACAMRICQR